MRSVWKPVVLVFTAAVVLSLFESVGLEVRYTSFGRTVPWYDSLWRPLPHWLTMAMVAPLAIAFSVRFRVRPGQWQRIAYHGVAALAFGVIHISLGTVVYNFILRMPRALFGVVRGQLAFDIGMELMAYTLIAVGTHAYLSHDEARREREAAARAEADLAQARLRILRSQLQPHVLFNTLQAISTLALRHEHDAVVVAIARLSDVLRAALDEEGTEEIPLSRELEVTESYLEIQRLRRGSDLEIRREIDADVLDARVPPLLLQPLVENALKHGLGDRRGVLSLAAHRRDGRVELSIADDGVGLSNDGRPEGTGLRVTRERLRELYGEDQSLALESRTGGGAIVRVSLPYRPDDAEPSPTGVEVGRRSRVSEPSPR